MPAPPRPAAFGLPIRGLALLAIGGFASIAAAQGTGPHLGVGVVAGDAAGLDDGYVHFGGFVPLAQPDDRSALFLDGSLLLFNDGSDQLGGNLGVGYRSYCEATDSLLGGTVYYDRRDLGLAEFDQVGVALESLGKLFDYRLNVGAPINDANNGSIAFTTVDGEFGALLTENDYAAVRAFVAAYGLFHADVENTAGVRGRFEVRIADQCFVGGYVEHDDLFETTGGFTLEYRFGRGPSASERSSTNLLARLGDPLARRRHVVTAESAELGVTITGLGGPTTGGPTTTGGPETGGPTITPTGGGGRPTYRPPPRDEL